jgi:hypothetical protein
MKSPVAILILMFTFSVFAQENSVQERQGEIRNPKRTFIPKGPKSPHDSEPAPFASATDKTNHVGASGAQAKEEIKDHKMDLSKKDIKRKQQGH